MSAFCIDITPNTEFGLLFKSASINNSPIDTWVLSVFVDPVASKPGNVFVHGLLSLENARVDPI